AAGHGSMTSEVILHQFDRLNVWSRGGQRAPHKPLLALYALGRWSRGDRGEIPFHEAERGLEGLLPEFGPERRSYHPEYPFWHRRSAGAGVVGADGPLVARKGGSSPSKSELVVRHARAGFSDDVQAAFRSDPALVGKIAARLLEHHFPESLHTDILEAVGLT